MRFYWYFDKQDGTTEELTSEQVEKHLSGYQIDEAIEAKLADPLEEVNFMTIGGYIRLDI